MTQGSEVPSSIPPIDVTASGNKLLAQSIYEAFARGDIPAVLASFDANVEWNQAEGGLYPGTFRGPQAVLEGVIMRIGADWDDFKLTTLEFVGDGDTVVMLGEYSGTYKATGRSSRTPVAHALRFSGGKLVRYDQYVDTVLLRQAAHVAS